MMEIVDLQMADVARRLRENGLEVNLTDSARSWLAEKGYNPDFGARPLTRALQKHIESPLSKKLLAGEFERGDVITVDVADEGQDQLEFVHEQE
jgi:ATP-dependent Clp protease ATP-binding subunit ClpA